MRNTDFPNRQTRDFIVARLADLMEISENQLGYLREIVGNEQDEIIEQSYHAFRKGVLTSADTLAIAR